MQPMHKSVYITTFVFTAAALWSGQVVLISGSALANWAALLIWTWPRQEDSDGTT